MTDSYAVLRNRDFRLLLGTQGMLNMGNQAQAVIVGWQVYSLTHSPLLLGLIGLTEAVPALIGALFSGHFVDVGRPHRIYLACLGVLMLNTLALLLIGGGLVQVPGGNILPYLFGAVFISGLSRSFSMPAAFALIGQIIPRPQMSAAGGWRISVIQFSHIAGPALAGLIYGGYGPGIAWIMPVCLISGAFITLALMAHATRHFRNPPRPEKAWQSMKAGWRFILRHQVLMGVMALDMFAVLFGGAIAMLPAFADQVLHVGSEGLGLLRASPAMGSILMALVLAVRPMKTIRLRWLLYVVALYGLSMIGFGLSTSFIAAALFLALSGAFDSVSVIIRGTVAQWLTPDDMRGRVSAVNSMFIISSNEIGAFESGLAARLLGLVPSIIVGGCATLLVVAVTALLVPKLRHDEIHPHSHKSN